jgi:hypothetical protein
MLLPLLRWASADGKHSCEVSQSWEGAGEDDGGSRGLEGA